MKNKNIYDLLSAYLLGTITPEEMEQLKVLINITDDNELALYVHQLWNEYEIHEEPSPLTLQKIYRRIRHKTSRYTLQQTAYKVLRVAAILLIPLLSALSIYLYTTKEKGYLDESREILFRTSSGQQASMVLSDGTSVRLNAESQLTYMQDYGQMNRSVNLSGEAYFEVEKDTLKPFIVYTGDLDVEVLGTSFNVYSYEEEDIAEMTLISGRIKVSTHTSPAQTVYLNPNEKIVFNKVSGKIKIEETDNRFETAWLKGALVFRSKPMKDVKEKLERKYGVTIHMDDPLIANDLFTGSFDCDNIVEVMKILQTHYTFTYVISGNHVFINPS